MRWGGGRGARRTPWPSTCGQRWRKPSCLRPMRRRLEATANMCARRGASSSLHTGRTSLRLPHTWAGPHRPGRSCARTAKPGAARPGRRPCRRARPNCRASRRCRLPDTARRARRGATPPHTAPPPLPAICVSRPLPCTFPPPSPRAFPSLPTGPAAAAIGLSCRLPDDPTGVRSNRQPRPCPPPVRAVAGQIQYTLICTVSAPARYG